eukprot:683714-Hanusia_phi.AAC.1
MRMRREENAIQQLKRQSKRTTSRQGWQHGGRAMSAGGAVEGRGGGGEGEGTSLERWLLMPRSISCASSASFSHSCPPLTPPDLHASTPTAGDARRG